MTAHSVLDREWGVAVGPPRGKVTGVEGMEWEGGVRRRGAKKIRSVTRNQQGGAWERAEKARMRQRGGNNTEKRKRKKEIRDLRMSYRD
jgi:hypothetical protein